MRMRYTSDLTDTEWPLIDYCFPKPSKTGRPRKHSYRELLNAVFYVVRTACQWRNLPKDFAPWPTVYHYFRLWKRTGLWEQIHTHLREHLRRVAGRQRHATAAIIDSQSVKSTECSDQRGYDAGKKVNGRKRHVLVDTLGLVLLVLVLPANLQDRDAARQLLGKYFGQPARRRVKHIWADGGYAGALVAWTVKLWRCTIEIVKRTEAHVFQVLPRRWVVERTFGWLGRYRRLHRDYERQAQTGEVMVYLAMIRLMLARLGKN
jgi:putative transposase